MSNSIQNVGSFLNMLTSQHNDIHTKQMPLPINPNPINSYTDTLTLSPTLNSLQQFLSVNDANNNNNNGQEELSLSSLEQLKQQGDMLASMLKMKLKNFESNLMTSMKNAGIEQTTPLDIKNDQNGLNVINNAPNKQIIQNLLQNNGNFKNQFQEIAKLSTLINAVQQLNNTQNNNISEAGAKYAQFSQQNTINSNNNQRKNESDFILHILESESSTMF
ncbi:MAG: hypothetical protein LBP59_16785 [Planctomycetaceae bacterium]|jgi:hypothetical protein|nr:hypothetical protein [Planctomycetaceae bacterium]